MSNDIGSNDILEVAMIFRAMMKANMKPYCKQMPTNLFSKHETANRSSIEPNERMVNHNVVWNVLQEKQYSEMKDVTWNIKQIFLVLKVKNSIHFSTEIIHSSSAFVNERTCEWKDREGMKTTQGKIHEIWEEWIHFRT